MQHTTKYKFNLIETSDTFSPDALNENTRDIETQLTALAAADAALAQATANADAALQATAAADKAELLAAMGTHGKTCRIATGSYKGTGKSVTVDFKPYVLFLTYTGSDFNRVFLAVRAGDYSLGTSDNLSDVEWENRKVSWSDDYSSQTASSTNYYVVLGVDE